MFELPPLALEAGLDHVGSVIQWINPSGIGPGQAGIQLPGPWSRRQESAELLKVGVDEMTGDEHAAVITEGDVAVHADVWRNREPLADLKDAGQGPGRGLKVAAHEIRIAVHDVVMERRLAENVDAAEGGFEGLDLHLACTACHGIRGINQVPGQSVSGDKRARQYLNDQIMVQQHEAVNGLGVRCPWCVEPS